VGSTPTEVTSKSSGSIKNIEPLFYCVLYKFCT